MKRVSLFVILILISAIAQAEIPTVNIPGPLREPNYGTGSCVVASTISMLRWQGRYKTADRLRSRYSGGQSQSSMCNILDHEKITYATGRSMQFLEVAIKTRRGCVITINTVGPGVYTTADTGYHAVTLVHLTPTHAGILDNNCPDRIVWLHRKDFDRYWYASPQWAIVTMYTPASPRLK